MFTLMNDVHSKTGVLSLVLLSLIACSAPTPSAQQSQQEISETPLISRTAPSVTNSRFKAPEEKGVKDIRDRFAGQFLLEKPVRRRLKEPLKNVEAGIEVPFYEFSTGFDVDNDGGETEALPLRSKWMGLENTNFSLISKIIQSWIIAKTSM